MDRSAIKQFIGRLVAHFGITYTTHVLDQLKALGFRQATSDAISLGIDDLLTAPSKGWLIEDAEQYSNPSEKHHNYGDLHAVEKLRQLIETWYATSEYLKQEMNPNFGMTDPSNPVHMMSFSGARGSTSQVHQLVGMRGLMSDPQGQIIDLPIRSNFREGLSLTEYIISCYGARKGVVDTAVRTSDAGYLTRRLVEVVQHIAVRKTDCGTSRGIFINNFRGRRSIPHQKLVGRVLAENIYINNRCFATRNEDIGISSAGGLIASRAETISIRSPLTCKSMLWICQLCHGWSLTNGNLVEIGEAVGIIAGQSIGEPGTQLTLRTFHTGGVFTGDIAEHVRTPFNGIIRFNESLVHPTRTRHGRPAWICNTNLLLTIRGRNEIHDLTVPPKSLLLVQNSQYVESKQVIAEIRAKKSPLKEKVHKYIYSNLGGEMHWSTKVRHASEYIHSNIHSILKTCHIWILSGKSYNKSDELSVSLYKNQDKIEFQTVLTKEELLIPPVLNKNQLNICISNLYFSKRNKFMTKPELTHAILNNLDNSVDSNTVLYGYSVRRKDDIISLTNKYVNFLFVPEIQESGILRNNEALAISYDAKYETKKSGIIRYGTIRIGSIDETYDSGDARASTSRPRYRIVKGGNSSPIPEEVRVSTRASSSFPRKSDEFVQAGASIASDITSNTSGLVRIRKKINNTYEVKILPGTIYHPSETYKISKQMSIPIPPRKKLFNEFQCDHWTYLQWIMPHKEKPFVLIRPAIEYEISDVSDKKINLLNLLRKSTDLEILIVNYILYGDCEQIQLVKKAIVGRGIRLIQTCLIVNWKKKYFLEKAHVSFLRIRTKNNFRNFLQICLISCPPSDSKKQEKVSDSRYVLRENYCNNSFSICVHQLTSKYQGLIHVSSDRNNEMQSLNIVSSSDLVGIQKINESKDFIRGNGITNYPPEKFFDFCKESEDSHSVGQWVNDGSKNNSLLTRKESMEKMNLPNNLGLIGNLQDVTDPYESFYLVTRTKAISKNYPIINWFRNTHQNPKWYFVDEYQKFHKIILGRSINYNLFEWLSPSFSLSGGIIQYPICSVGQFLFENFYVSEYGGILPSSQIIGIHTNHLVVRLAKPFLATERATIHNNCGESIKEGDTSITLTYERLKSGDIIQGLPKVEQLLEARSVNSVSINLENGFENWNSDMKKFIGNLWGLFLSAKISMEQGQFNLVDQIQKVYQSQGVYVSNKHIEIIVRQMTSRVTTLENGTINIFLPGELIESSRARRMNRVLEEVIPYEPILLGITKASLNTQSFISEASSQETTRVLARAALKGRIDWLKGLKENVILGGVIPAGTGSMEVIWQINLEKKRETFEKNKPFGKQIKNIFLYGNTFPKLPTLETVHNVLKGSVSQNISK